MAIPTKVDVIDDWMSDWTANGDVTTSTTYTWKATAHNKMYVTLGRPITSLSGFTPTTNTATLKRVDWACTLAKGLMTPRAVADKVWNQIGEPQDFIAGTHTNVDAPYEPGEGGRPILPDGTNDWALLDGQYSGECDEQARLMTRILGTLGVPAQADAIRASQDLTDVFNVETRQDLVDPVTGSMRIAYLVMDYTPSGSADHQWNNFEACCIAANHYYAVWPKYDADTAAALFTTLPFRQFWVFMQGNKVPGTKLDDGVNYAGVEKIADPNEVPKPTP